MATKREFGNIRRLPSKRYQARYTGPDGAEHRAPRTFAAKVDAEAWLADRRREIDRNLWNPMSAAVSAPTTFGEYSTQWLVNRSVRGRPIKDRTREHYATLLRAHILPTFGATALDMISPDAIRDWYGQLAPGTETLRAHSYSLIKTILQSAANADLIVANPCKVEGAATARRKSRTKPATLEEVEAIVLEMPERLRLMVLLATWCAMRFGELVELRRGDVDLGEGVIAITRAAVRLDGGQFRVTTPKSESGTRDVHIPPHLLPTVDSHLSTHVERSRTALLFPAGGGGHLQPSTLYRHFYRAREAVGRNDLRFHDLRHTGAVLAAMTGATLAELMDRLGHSTPAAAMRYQHSAQGRDKKLAEALSRMATGDTPT